jgi:hypothetical protein
MATCGIHSGSKFGKLTSSKDLVSWGSASSMASFTQSFHFGSFRLHFLKLAAGTRHFFGNVWIIFDRLTQLRTRNDGHKSEEEDLCTGHSEEDIK